MKKSECYWHLRISRWTKHGRVPKLCNQSFPSYALVQMTADRNPCCFNILVSPLDIVRYSNKLGPVLAPNTIKTKRFINQYLRCHRPIGT